MRQGEFFGLRVSYIATQGPLLETIADFWRMMWEQRVPLIVMVANPVEQGRVKCEIYWPKVGATASIGMYTVTCDREEAVYDGVVQRWFRLCQRVPRARSSDDEGGGEDSAVADPGTDGGECRCLVQLQYVGWPDHGVPAQTKGFRDLLHAVDRQIDASRGRLPGPVVVHCSAGIGRTGTFLATHILLLMARSRLAQSLPLHFDVFSIVLKLREQRPGLVETAEQYRFVHLVGLEELEAMGVRFMQ